MEKAQYVFKYEDYACAGGHLRYARLVCFANKKWPLFVVMDSGRPTTIKFSVKDLVVYIPKKDYIKGILLGHPVALVLRKRKMYKHEG